MTWHDTEQLEAAVRVAKTKRDRLAAESEAADRALLLAPDSEGHRERADNLRRGLAAAQGFVDDMESTLTDRSERVEAMRTLGGRPENTEGGWREPSYLGGMSDLEPDRAPDHLVRARDVGYRAIERVHTEGVMSDHAAGRMEKLVRGDGSGIAGRYLSAVGDPAYGTAFCKMLQYGEGASLRMSPREIESFRIVSQVEAERAMSDGTGSAGGFAVPITIDPTILLTSSGALNPIRQLADVRQLVSDTLRLVSADSPTAAYTAEAAEVSDASPTLVQPTITTQRGTAFVPFSIELEQDWAGIQQALGKLLADARDILDNLKFLTGSGTNEPLGVLTIGTTGSLTTAQRVLTGTTAATAIADVYSLKSAIGATRFFKNATFVAHPATWDTTYRYVGAGSTTDPLPMPDGRGGDLLGVPKAEWNAMDTGTTSGKRTMLVADWSGYVIGDRLGTLVEIVPHIFGAANRYPLGQRGLFTMWRTGTVVSKPNAFRYLEVK
jgi:HK97 family phage major capsid protein